MANFSDRVGGFFRRFKRERGDSAVGVHLNGDDGQNDYSDGFDGDDAATAVLDEPGHNGNGNGNGHGLAKPNGSRDSTLSKLERGYDEVVDLMQSVRSHLSEQSERSERLVSILEGLPEALRGLPESSRRQAQMLESIQTHLDRQAISGEKLTDAISGLSKSTEAQDQAMSAMQQQLAAQHETDQLMLGSFSQINGTLSQVGESNQASADMLRQLAEHAERSDRQMRDLFSRGQKQMLILAAVGCGVGVIAMTVAMIVAIAGG